MIYLLLAILCGAAISICFKIFKKLDIDSLQGIFVNYLTAIVVSLLLSGDGIAAISESISEAIKAPWLWLAIFEGLLFMGGIVVLAASTQRSGLAVTNVAARASLVIPVVASYFFYNEGNPKWMAIALTLLSMVLIFGKKSNDTRLTLKSSILPICVFFTYGICDFMLKVTKSQLNGSPEGSAMLFIFGAAAVFCLISYILRGNFSEHPYNWKAIPGGIILGLVNSGCTALMMKGLGVIDGVIFFPAYNIGVVCITMFIGLTFFKERLSPIQFIGIALALVSIILLLVL